MNELVERLTKKQPIEAALRASEGISVLKEQIDRGYVHLRFPNTKGGTELGVRLETDQCDLAKGDFEKKQGRVKLVGKLTLNYENVRCHAEIDLATSKGEGRLEHLGSADPLKKN